MKYFREAWKILVDLMKRAGIIRQYDGGNGMGKTLWKGAEWVPYSEGVDDAERVTIQRKLVERINTLSLKGGEFEGYVALQLPVTFHATSKVLTVACEVAAMELPISVRCYTWGFQYIDVDVVAFWPKRWHRIDPDTGLRLPRKGGAL